MSCTLFLWMRVPDRSTAVTERYKTALIISGLVTFIAAYHYIRIFNSWVEAYAYPMGAHGVLDEDHTFHRYPGHYTAVPMGYHNPGNPKLTGTPFNDAYRYMDWLLTVPLLLMEIVMVMNLPAEESSSRCWTLGAGSALMIISGYKGELVLTGLSGRASWWRSATPRTRRRRSWTPPSSSAKSSTATTTSLRSLPQRTTRQQRS